MQRIYIAVLALVAASFGLMAPASAQQDADRGVPVEFYACHWQDGKDMGDLDRVIKKFNKWADQRDSGYGAWLLTPQFHDDVDFDIGWLGSWPDANDFGRLQDAWVNEGTEISAAFDEVVDCSGRHQMATSAVVNAPDGPPQNGVVMFSECAMNDGVNPVDALATHRKMGQTMRDMGSKAMAWLFYPALGVSNENLDYWSVVAFNSYTDMGAAMEMWTNGGGWEKAAVLMAGVSTCTSTTVYDARLVRAGEQR